MKKSGIRVINPFFACGMVFPVKPIYDTKTAFGRYHSDHLITEPTQISYPLLKQLYPEPYVVLYRANGIPARRIGGYIVRLKEKGKRLKDKGQRRGSWKAWRL